MSEPMQAKLSSCQLGISDENWVFSSLIWISSYLERIETLQAENTKLRAALEAVEWTEYGTLDPECPWCHCDKCFGHADDCQRQVALGIEVQR